MNFFSKCDQIRSFLWIWSLLLKKSLMENFIFQVMYSAQTDINGPLYIGIDILLQLPCVCLCSPVFICYLISEFMILHISIFTCFFFFYFFFYFYFILVYFSLFFISFFFYFNSLTFLHISIFTCFFFSIFFTFILYQFISRYFSFRFFSIFIYLFLLVICSICKYYSLLGFTFLKLSTRIGLGIQCVLYVYVYKGSNRLRIPAVAVGEKQIFFIPKQHTVGWMSVLYLHVYISVYVEFDQ